MTTKYVDGFEKLNENIVRPRRIKIFDDAGRGVQGFGAVPDSLKQYITVDEFSNGIVNRTKLTCTALPISIADDADVAQYGGAGKIYDFPEGMLCTMGAVIDGSITLGTTGTIIATYDGDIALGSAAATTGATLISTEATFLQSVALTQAVDSVANCDAQSVATALTEAGSRWVDGTATAADMYLNIVIDDDASHTAGTGSFTGTIEFVWMLLGDN